MRGGALPPALLAAALGFALAFAPRRAVAPSLAIFAGVAVAIGLATVPSGWTDAVFYGCWASVAVTALAVHLPKRLAFGASALMSANAGLWAGGAIAAAGVSLDLAKALPWALIAVPGAWLIRRDLGIAVKVAASWLVAVSVLAATLPVTTTTPGYVGDHME